MKTGMFLLLALAMLACSGGAKEEAKSNAFTVDFEKTTYAQAKAKAQKQQKVFMVDFYSDT